MPRPECPLQSRSHGRLPSLMRSKSSFDRAMSISPVARASSAVRPPLGGGGFRYSGRSFTAMVPSFSAHCWGWLGSRQQLTRLRIRVVLVLRHSVTRGSRSAGPEAAAFGMGAVVLDDVGDELFGGHHRDAGGFGAHCRVGSA